MIKRAVLFHTRKYLFNRIHQYSTRLTRLNSKMTIYIYIYMFYMCALYTYMFYICYTHIYVLSWVVNVNRLEIPTTLKSPQIVTSIETIYDWAFWQP